MKKSIIIGVAVAAVVVIGGSIVLATHKTTNSSTTGMNMSTSKTTTSTTTPATATNIVNIENFAFAPANITVKKGTVVTWNNKDSATHTITETDGKSGPDSGNIASGASFNFTYQTAGVYKYHCSIHSSMVGTVTVTD